MAKQERICIHCYSPLKKESKQLGNKSVWWVCTECGLRERETSAYISGMITEKFQRAAKEERGVNFKMDKKKLF